MSLKDCITSAEKQGKISKDEGAQLRAEYDDLLRVYKDPGKAKKALLNLLEATGEESRRLALITENVRLKGNKVIMTYTDEWGQKDPAAAYRNMYHHTRDEGRGIDDAQSLEEAIRSRAMGDIHAFVQEFRKGWVIGGGLRRRMPTVRAKLDDVGRALLKEKVKDPRAQAMADALMKVSEDLRVRANEAGANIGKIEYGYIPTSWKPEALLNFVDRFGMDALVDKVLPELHPERMRDPLTGQPLTPERLRESTKIGLENAMSEGMINEDNLNMPQGRGALFKRLGHHRFFHFKDFDAWKRTMDEFGNSDVYAVFETHIAAMSRDIAHMETFGPNPNVLRTYFANLVRQLATTTPSADQLLSRSKAQLMRLVSRLPNGEGEAMKPKIEELIKLHRQRYDNPLPTPERPAKSMGDVSARIAEIEQELNLLKPGEAADMATTHVALEMGAVLSDLNRGDFFAGIGNPRVYADKQIRRADVMWEHMRGALTTPYDIKVGVAARQFSETPDLIRLGQLGKEILRAPFTAQGQAGIRNWITASLLGSAVLSSVLSDPVFGAARRAFVGMSREKTWTVRVIAEGIRMLRPLNRAQLERAWFNIDQTTSTWQQTARWTGTFDPRTFTGFLADRVMSGSGMSALTSAFKGAFVRDFMGFVADNSGKTWGDLDKNFRDTLHFHGFDQGSWEKLRTTTQNKPSPTSAGWVRPNEVMAEHGRALAERYMMMIHREMNHAIPEGNVTSRSMIFANTKPGTLPGELVRSFAQFKSFPTAVFMLTVNQIVRDLGGAGDPVRGARYAATLLITGSIMGVFTLALKDLKDGRDPRRWMNEDGYLDPNMWGAALLQSGGMGIYGDFLFSNLNRFGSSLPVSVAGPAVSWMDDIRQLTLGNAAQAIQGKDTKIGADLVRVMRRNSPGATMWYLSTAYNRAVLDQLQIMWDKDAYSAFNRDRNTQRREYRRDYWWDRGDVLPKRAPNLDVLRSR